MDIKLAGVVPFVPVTRGPVPELVASADGAALDDSYPVKRLGGGLRGGDRLPGDRRLSDYAIIGLLSIVFHATVVRSLSDMKDREVIVPPKVPPMVNIELIRPPVIPEIKPAPPPPPPPPPKPATPPKQVKPSPPVPAPKPKPATRPIDTPAPVQRAEPVATPVQPVTAPTPSPAPVEEKVTQPSASAAYLHNPPPPYPEYAMENGWEGKVWLNVHVLPNGKPDQVSVKTSSGWDILDESAVKTVKKWTFVPAMRGSTPIAGWVAVPITFKLQD